MTTSNLRDGRDPADPEDHDVLQGESRRRRRPGVARVIGRPSRHERQAMDALQQRLADITLTLREQRGELDDLHRRSAVLEGRTPLPRRRPEPPTGPGHNRGTWPIARRRHAHDDDHASDGLPDWVTTRDQAIATLTALEQRDASRRSAAGTGTTVAAGEHLLDAVAAAETSPDWYLDLLERFPGIEPETVVAMATAGPGPELDGMTTLLRGFRGEQLVIEGLLDGALPVPPGTIHAQLVETTFEPGADVRLLTDQGLVEAQVKITASPDLVLTHYARYPHIDIVYTSSDAAARLDGAITATGPIRVIGLDDTWPTGPGPVVVDIGHTSSKLSAETFAAMTAEVPDGLIDGVLGEIPMFAFAVLAVRASHRWLTTDEPSDSIRDATLDGAKEVGIASAAGTAAKLATGTEWLAAPVTLTTALGRGVWRTATTDLARSTSRAERATEQLRQSRQRHTTLNTM